MGRFVPLSIPNFEGNERKYVDDALDGFPPVVHTLQSWKKNWQSFYMWRKQRQCRVELQRFICL